MGKRVVVTGMGIVSSLGFEVDEFWDNIKNGKNGISRVESFDISEYPSKVASEIKDFDVKKYLDFKIAKRMDKFTQYACISSQKAFDNSKINMDEEDPFDVGVIIGSGIGGIHTFAEQHSNLINKGSRRVSPFFIPMMIPNMATGRVAMQFGAKGFNECVVTACATSTNVLGNAYHVIKRGDAKVMIAGGAEASITPMAFAGFCQSKALTVEENPNKACRPFDKNRDGFIMGEGACTLILEEYEHAIKRKAKIYGEIVGFGATNDAYDIVKPDENALGTTKAMENAIKMAGIDPSEVDYCNAHGTSTPYNDKYETLAFKNVFKEHAYNIAISSTKSMTGHLLGATGACEVMISILALKDGYIPPTINYEVEDEDCDLDYVPNKGRKKDIEYALSNSLGFGGHNSCIVMKKYTNS